jgi:hypothetical protein
MGELIHDETTKNASYVHSRPKHLHSGPWILYFVAFLTDMKLDVLWERT